MFWSPETNHSPNMQNAARKQNKRERKKAEYPKSGNNCEVRDLECFIFSNASLVSELTEDCITEMVPKVF